MREWIYRVIFTILAVTICWLIVDMFGIKDMLKQSFLYEKTNLAEFCYEKI